LKSNLRHFSKAPSTVKRLMSIEADTVESRTGGGGRKFVSKWKKNTGKAAAGAGSWSNSSDRTMVAGGEAWAGQDVGASAGVGPAAAAAATAAAAAKRLSLG
jgi:hypothetical protein